MTGVEATQLPNRVRVLRFGRPQVPPTPIEAAAVAFANSPSMLEAQRFLITLSRAPQTHVYRTDLLHTCQAALQIRERQRHTGRTQSRRRVGSTLLLKGLEADVAVILAPREMTTQHLYVAMTRGARQLIVCSPTNILIPAR